jgi:hypothetical protein
MIDNHILPSMFCLTPAIRAGAVPQGSFRKTISRNRSLNLRTERNGHHNVHDRFEPSRAYLNFRLLPKS